MGIISILCCPEYYATGLKVAEDSREGFCSNLCVACSCGFMTGFSSTPKENKKFSLSTLLVFGLRLIGRGITVDLEVMTRYCKMCEMNVKCEHVCSNYKRSSGNMEAVGAFRIFERSLIKRDLQYTEYYGDGDSKGFLQVKDIYGENSVAKLECVGHIQKRGTRLRKLKKNTKGLGGKGKLTDKFVDKLQNYYGIAIRSNVGCLEKMHSAVLVAFFHCCFSNQNPMHGQCPAGKDSWCKYKQALCDGKKSAPNVVTYLKAQSGRRRGQGPGLMTSFSSKNMEVGPVGHNVTVNGDRYRAMITNFFIPELNNHDVQEMWFQQDGATCHAARATIDLLKDTLGDRLISHFGPVNGPPRSCDLTPLNYFLWGYVKSLVYADKPQTLDHLEDNIRRVIADIRPQMLEKVIENWTSRLDYIRASRGSPMPEIIFKM
ncbi:uncharacterized protein TNCV_1888361 [Trichonephila clavipes]|nr:uncharacterized protein TNCV_1888361 [Trichonephila clavipes]